MEILNSFLCNWGSADSNMLLFFLFISFLLGIFGAYLIWGIKIQEKQAQLLEQTSIINGLNDTIVQLEESNNKSNKSLEALIQKNNALSRDISALNDALTKSQESITLNKAIEAHRSLAAEALPVFEQTQATSNQGDDLKKIEGIGSQIEVLLQNAGILSFKQLSETGDDRLREILGSAGNTFLVHDPTTWPLQAALAYEGKWDELAQWQTQLKWGKG
ncbi:MAG: hypothetical protein ACOYOA_05615 [Saprospiraceae bacterium]